MTTEQGNAPDLDELERCDACGEPIANDPLTRGTTFVPTREYPLGLWREVAVHDGCSSVVTTQDPRT